MAVSCPEDCFVSYVQKILQIYQGYTKRYGPGLIDMTFYMSNVDARKTVLSTTCRSLHFYDQVINDPRHAEDGESRVICSWDNVGAVYIPLGLIINNYHAMPLGRVHTVYAVPFGSPILFFGRCQVWRIYSDHCSNF